MHTILGAGGECQNHLLWENTPVTRLGETPRPNWLCYVPVTGSPTENPVGAWMPVLETI
ncbi:hypothetical protein [Nostoc sp. DSM 114161]|uniref:hypothetical protein n=1 Tax=Nostoc sp. DSM 114161 TaxID=3440143 RepID=UPI00404597EE